MPSVVKHMHSFLFPVVLLGFGFFGTSLAAAPSTEYSVKEEIILPRNWVKLSQPSSDHDIHLRIGLKQSNFHVLERILYEVSDPYHEHYGQHLSKSEVEALVAPRPESLNLVNEWLSSFGVNEDSLVRSPAKDWITLKVSVGLAEKMLDTTYYVWKHSESDDYLVRTTSYSLPSHLHDHIDLIQPTTVFGRFKQQKLAIASVEPDTFVTRFDSNAAGIDSRSGVTVNSSCNETMTVNCLKELYNAVGVVPSAPNNSIAVTGYSEEFANIQDLQLFYADQVPAAVGSNFTFVSVDGGTNNQTLADAGPEANLDTQYAFGMAFPVPAIFFSTPGKPVFIPDALHQNNSNEPYTTWLDFVLAQSYLPLAISTSYGDDEQTVPRSFAIRACGNFAQLGARGVSVMFASGDGGVGDRNPDPATQQCFSNDGRNLTTFIPIFPATCPFVTAVGATTNVPEVAANFSGGGFSNYFTRPAYQEADVAAYLNTLPEGTYTGLFNSSGRAFPDVSAQGTNFQVFLKGKINLLSGTSASTPTFTAIIALLNGARLNANLSSLGFLNPFLYSKGFAGLNDITEGNNLGCGTEGFNATKGWDPVTGLGTPNYEALKALVT